MIRSDGINLLMSPRVDCAYFGREIENYSFIRTFSVPCNHSSLSNQKLLSLQIPLALFCFRLLSIHLISWSHQLEYCQSEEHVNLE
jgi:hypothetical protein